MLEIEKRESLPLTVEEVLIGAGYLCTANPYEALVRSVGRWI